MKKEVMICDRCGEMYEEGQKVMASLDPNGCGVKILYDVIIAYRTRTSPEEKYYYDNNKPVCGKDLDLCPTCAGLFFNWLLNKTDNGTILREHESTCYLDDIGTGTRVIQPGFTISKTGETDC